MYRVIIAFGKQGVEVIENDKVVRFYSSREIEISPKIKIPSNLDKELIPEFERTEHYRVSQLWYFKVDYPNLIYIKTDQILTEEEINNEVASHSTNSLPNPSFQFIENPIINFSFISVSLPFGKYSVMQS